MPLAPAKRRLNFRLVYPKEKAREGKPSRAEKEASIVGVLLTTDYFFHGIPRTILGPIILVNHNGNFCQTRTARPYLGLVGRMSDAAP
jgi:hypothetical protein